MTAPPSTPTGPLRVVQPDTLDRTLPGVNVLADRLETMLDEHRDLRAVAHGDPDMDVVADALAQLSKLTARIFATWDAVHAVTGAEQQARRTVDGIVRGYVVDADREARVSGGAYVRAARRLRGLVRGLADQGYATEAGALP